MIILLVEIVTIISLLVFFFQKSLKKIHLLKFNLTIFLNIQQSIRTLPWPGNVQSGLWIIKLFIQKRIHLIRFGGNLTHDLRKPNDYYHKTAAVIFFPRVHGGCTFHEKHSPERLEITVWLSCSIWIRHASGSAKSASAVANNKTKPHFLSLLW